MSCFLYARTSQQVQETSGKALFNATFSFLFFFSSFEFTYLDLATNSHPFCSLVAIALVGVLLRGIPVTVSSCQITYILVFVSTLSTFSKRHE